MLMPLSNLKQLNLAHNHLLTLAGVTNLPQLDILDLSHNNISLLEEETMITMFHCMSVDLSGNQLWTIANPSNAVNSSVIMSLYENPLQCDAQLCWLKYSVEKSDVQFLLSTYPCSSPTELVQEAWEDITWDQLCWNSGKKLQLFLANTSDQTDCARLNVYRTNTDCTRHM